MLETVKRELRVTNDAFDGDIDSQIKAARLELIRAGITDSVANDESNDLVKQAIIAFCKSRFGFDNADSPRFEMIFENMKQALSMSGDYNALE